MPGKNQATDGLTELAVGDDLTVARKLHQDLAGAHRRLRQARGQGVAPLPHRVALTDDEDEPVRGQRLMLHRVTLHKAIMPGDLEDWCHEPDP